MRTWPSLLLLVPCLAGCPDAKSSTPAPATAVLQLDVAPADRKAQGPRVGETLQLRLSWGAGSPQRLINTLVDKAPASTQWVVEPQGVVTIDPQSAQARLIAPGEVTIRATYRLDGQPVRSNPLRLKVGGGQATVNKTAAKTSK